MFFDFRLLMSRSCDKKVNIRIAKPQKHKSYLSGFMIVELSIVLITIALVAGGILAGSSLLESARYSAQIQQIAKVEQSVLGFQTRFGQLPGDLRNASSFFTSNTQPQSVTNGNGNNRICGLQRLDVCDGITEAEITDGNTYYSWWWAEISEFMSVFDHLSASGLFIIPQYFEKASSSAWSGPVSSNAAPGIGYPRLKIKSSGNGPLHGGPSVQNMPQGGLVVGYDPPYGYYEGGHRMRLSGCNWDGTSETGNIGFNCGLNPWQAEVLDRRIDDGRPFSGSIVAIPQTRYDSVMNVASFEYPYSYYCVTGTGSSAVYKNASNLHVWGGAQVYRSCYLSVRAIF